MERPWRSPIEIPELLKDYLKGKTFCEIGCGEGDLLREFAKYADKAYGIEHNSDYFNELDKVNKKIFYDNLSKIGYVMKKTENSKNRKFNNYIVKAFQRRFRQDLVNGIIDEECLLISKNLTKNLK